MPLDVRPALTALRNEWSHLITLQPSRRPWQMPIAAAFACGLPLLLSAWLGHLDFGLVATLGGLVFLYLPNTTLSQRMVFMMACAFGMSACFALGLLTHLLPSLLLPLLVLITLLVTMICRHYRVGPPGSLFFIMAAAIGAYTPITSTQIPQQIGLMFMGALLATLVAFFYSLWMIRQRPAETASAAAANLEDVVVDAVIISVFVGIALATAQLLQLHKPYWVPISCLAVMQGASLRAVWTRQLHRVLGTVLGMAVAGLLFSMPLDAWRIACLITLLIVVVEILVVRHYALAVCFITPMTILLADAAAVGEVSSSSLMHARLLDTLLGCVIGMLGGLCLHQPRLRQLVSQPLQALMTNISSPSTR